MKKQIDIPDKTIELSHGDKVEIYVDEDKINFHFFCDGTGNCFALTMDEINDLMYKDKKTAQEIIDEVVLETEYKDFRNYIR